MLELVVDLPRTGNRATGMSEVIASGKASVTQKDAMMIIT